MKRLSFLGILIVTMKIIYAVDDSEIVEVIMGEPADLPCNISTDKSDDVLSTLAWYKNGSATAFYSGDYRDGRHGERASTSSNKQYRLVNNEDGMFYLRIMSVAPADAGLYHCSVTFDHSPTRKTFVQLQVIEPPERLWVLHQNGTWIATTSLGSNTSEDIGPYYVGDKIFLYCVAFQGKPLPTLSWVSEQRLLKNTSTQLSASRVRSALELGPLSREDHGRVVTCEARNHNDTKPLFIDITIDMYLSPELVSIHAEGEGASGRVRAGDQLSLICRVLGARPLPSIIWRVDGDDFENLEQNITREISQRLVASTVQMSVEREMDEKSVTCCVPAYSHQEQYVCAPAMPLTVTYSPVLTVESDGTTLNSTLDVVKGSNVSLKCNFKANPGIYQLIWFHEDDKVNKDDNDVLINPYLNLTDVNEADGGEYVCAAANDEGPAYSETLLLTVTYPAYCEDNDIAEYGLGENESMNVTCRVKSVPPPISYRWVTVDKALNITSTAVDNLPFVETENATLLYKRPNNTTFSTIFCWGVNEVSQNGMRPTPCTFLVTDETAPRPPTKCKAVKDVQEIVIKCEKGHDGGLPQRFILSVRSGKNEHLVSIINLEPNFIIQEPIQKDYTIAILATNDKGDSSIVEIESEDVVDENAAKGDIAVSAVTNITTLTMALCGGVLVVALAACGLVLCAHERSGRADLPRAASDPPLCAYNTEESNCETYHDSDEGSDCNVRRTESFRRAMARYPSQNYDVRRTSSFQNTRYMNEIEQEGISKCSSQLRHSTSCRMHSMQNICRKREMDTLCDHLVTQLPQDVGYSFPKQMNTFYTMPRKNRHKSKEINDEASVITQTSDGYSLPPPPDEFTSYRAGTRIRDVPKPSAHYSVVKRKKSIDREPIKYNAMNTVAIATVSGAPNSLYTYPDDESHGRQTTTNPFDDSS